MEALGLDLTTTLRDTRSVAKMYVREGISGFNSDSFPGAVSLIHVWIH